MNIPPLHSTLTGLLFFSFQAQADTHYVDVNSTSPVAPYTSWATAATVIQDAVDAASDGDTVLVTNGVYDAGGKAIVGTMTNRVAVDKPLTLLSANGPEVTIIKGYQLPVSLIGDGAIRCVYLTNGSSLGGFTLTHGATRGHGPPGNYDDFQWAGGGVWCESVNVAVTNCVVISNRAFTVAGGVYKGSLDNVRLIDNQTGDEGGGAYQSVVENSAIVGNSARNGGGTAACTLIDCVLEGNTANAWSGYGGGAWGGNATNCILEGNSASVGGGAYVPAGSVLIGCTIRSNSASYGGGATAQLTLGALVNCALVGNSAGDGGGMNRGTLRNCTLVANTAGRGAGAWASVLNNCIVYYNTEYPARNTYSCTLNRCCTVLDTGGIGNITNAPLFVDTNSWADLRLQSNSPCINAGSNAYVTSTNDLDGNARIVGGTVDIGAYENQAPALMAYYQWLESYGLSTSSSIDNEDSDNDNATTWQEWKMWTIPTNQQSVLKMLHPNPTTNGTEVGWQSISGHSYTLERATNGSAEFTVLQSGIAGQAGTTSFTDESATNGNAFLYRVSVPE